MKIIKRNGFLEEFNPDKIKSAISKAFKACDYTIDDSVIQELTDNVSIWDNIHIL